MMSNSPRLRLFLDASFLSFLDTTTSRVSPEYPLLVPSCLVPPSLFA